MTLEIENPLRYKNQIFSILCFTYNNKSSNITTLGSQMVHLAPTPKKGLSFRDVLTFFLFWKRTLPNPSHWQKGVIEFALRIVPKYRNFAESFFQNLQNMYWYITISNKIIVSIVFTSFLHIILVSGQNRLTWVISARNTNC